MTVWLTIIGGAIGLATAVFVWWASEGQKAKRKRRYVDKQQDKAETDIRRGRLARLRDRILRKT